jgi:hypothetical protein
VTKLPKNRKSAKALAHSKTLPREAAVEEERARCACAATAFPWLSARHISLDPFIHIRMDGFALFIAALVDS